MKILIVEDEAVSALLIKKILEMEGHSVCDIAASGPDAIKSASRHQPDYVLMDVRLTGPMSGIEAAREIVKSQDCKIIIMSGYSSDELSDELSSIDTMAVFTKPVEIAQLRSALI